MNRDMSMFALAGYLKRISELPEDRMLKAKPRELRQIKILENKNSPDFYVAGLAIKFIGLEFMARWYPVLGRRDGCGSYRKGLDDYDAGRFDFRDIIGELWRIRMSDTGVFDAALYLKHGEAEMARILAAINSTGEEEFKKREDEAAHEMDYYGLIDDEWLDHRKNSKDQEKAEETANAQL